VVAKNEVFSQEADTPKIIGEMMELLFTCY